MIEDLEPMPRNYALKLLKDDLATREGLLSVFTAQTAADLYKRARIMQAIESLQEAIRALAEIHDLRLLAAEPLGRLAAEQVSQEMDA